jgi:phosphoserine phosphatase
MAKHYTTKITLKQVLDWASTTQEAARTIGTSDLEDKISDAILDEYIRFELAVRDDVARLARLEGKSPKAYVSSMLRLMQQDK